MKTSFTLSAFKRSLCSVRSTALTGTALGAALFLGSAATLAQSASDPAAQSSRAALMAERLDLTETQRNQVREIMKNAHEGASADRQRLRELRQARRGASNDMELAAISEEMGQINDRLAQERTRTQAAVREVLTPEQRDEMAALREAGAGKDRKRGADGEGRGRPWAEGEHHGKGKGRPWTDGEHPGKGKGRHSDDGEHPGKGKGHPWADGEHPGKGKGRRADTPDSDES